jgi:hypothetical protein
MKLGKFARAQLAEHIRRLLTDSVYRAQSVELELEHKARFPKHCGLELCLFCNTPKKLQRAS